MKAGTVITKKQQKHRYLRLHSTKSMEVYLPADTRWYNYWTNEAIEGGQKLTVSTTLNRIPSLYVPAVSFHMDRKYNTQVKKNGTI